VNPTSAPGCTVAVNDSCPNGNVTPDGGETAGAAEAKEVSEPPTTCRVTSPPAVEIVSEVTAPFQVTWLSVDVDASLALLAASWAAPAGIEATTVPFWVMPETSTVYVVPEPLTAAVVAPAVPLRSTSPVANPVTGSLNTTVNDTGLVLVGSD